MIETKTFYEIFDGSRKLLTNKKQHEAYCRKKWVSVDALKQKLDRKKLELQKENEQIRKYRKERSNEEEVCIAYLNSIYYNSGILDFIQELLAELEKKE